jgi:hypothetical protein
MLYPGEARIQILRIFFNVINLHIFVPAPILSTGLAKKPADMLWDRIVPLTTPGMAS